MTFRRRLLALVAVAAAAPLGIAANARAADVPAHTVPPGATDPQILDTAVTRGPHLVYLAPEERRRVGKLLVFLPYGGPDQRTTEYEEVGSEAGRLGYHTIVLAYRNDVPIANPMACGMLEAAPALPENCAGNAREEILSGDQVSPVVAVDESNSIENRLNKLLVYLKTNFAEEGWSKFVDPNNKPVWSETVIAGGSLGAGMAVLIAEQHSVHRVSLFAGWTDARHGWVKRVATPAENYFSLIHVRDTFYERTCWAYKDLGLRETCPMPNPPSLVENNEPPFETRQLIFNLEPQPGEVVAGNIFHASTARDGPIRKESDGVTPVRALVNAWRSILGDKDTDGWLDLDDNCIERANPELTADGEQIDTDGDEIGDLCDPTPRGTAPVIDAPGRPPVDATGPAGAIVTYEATATDDIDPHPTVNCTPPSGAPFAIGDTLVECGSTDSLGNTSSASFVITVLGAKEQLTRLIGNVVNATGLSAAAKAQLTASLQSLVAGFDPNRPLQRAAACITLRAFTTLIRFIAPAVQATAWTADANRIRAVLAC